MAVFPAGGRDLLSSWRCFHQAGRADHAAPPSVRLQPCRVRETHKHTEEVAALLTQCQMVVTKHDQKGLTLNYKLVLGVNVSLNGEHRTHAELEDKNTEL